jgi:ubiquitin C-terminal hydrolase
MNNEIMEQRRDNERQRCPAGTNEELRTNTPRRRTARKHPEIIDETNDEQPRVLEQETLQRSTAQEEPERREEVAGIQYYRNDFIERRNKHHVATDGHNAGLVNNNVLCYANAIFQIIASCGCLNESLSNPPSMAHQHFSLYYNFASVISSMISGGNRVVDPMIFTNVFSERVPQFDYEQRKYLL